MRPEYTEFNEGLTNQLYAITVIFVLLALLFIFFLVVSLRRRRKMNLEKAALQSQFQEELLRTQLEIQEQTFKTISQELHDNIGQMLSLVKLHLNTVDLQKQEKAAEKIGSAKDIVSKAINDLRDLSKTLNTDTIAAAGLLNAIKAELHQLEKTGTLQTAFLVSGTHIKLDAQKELILFRIVQEALHNVIKHAQASQVSVSALFEEGQFQLTIADNGRGTADAGSTSGSGLRNMQSRSGLIGAGWQMESGKTGGTTIRITLPTTS
jgi:signal transduction histidine kinase